MNINKHRAHCSICQHPELEAIDEAIMEWRSFGDIALEFDVPKTNVWRHAKGVGLDVKRMERLDRVGLRVIERWLESGADVTTTNALDALWKVAKMRGMVVDLSKDLTASFDGRSDAEIAHYAEHGTWPAPGELEALEALDDDPTVQ